MGSSLVQGRAAEPVVPVDESGDAKQTKSETTALHETNPGRGLIEVMHMLLMVSRVTYFACLHPPLRRRAASSSPNAPAEQHQVA